MRVVELKILSSGDMSGNLLSAAQQLNQVIGIAIQAVYTGSPVGTLTLQVSNDAVNWTTYADSAVAVSGAGSAFWNYENSLPAWVRVVYTRTSGTGSLNITANCKGF